MAEYVTKIRTNEGDKQIDYNALANLPEISNPNLLINSDFRNPVNQRGETSYTFNGAGVAYTIDRWCINYHSTLIVNDGYVTLQGNVDSNNYWYQPLEHAMTGTFTISVYVKSITNTNGYMGCYTVDDNNGEYRRFTLREGLNVITFNATNLNRIGFVAYKTGTVADIEWIKLEQSNVATSFTPRLYAEELMLCRRYYQTIELARLDVLCYLHHRNTDEYGGFIRVQPMRTTPTVTRTGYFFVEKYNSNGVHSVNENELQHLHFVPQFSGLKIGVGLSTQDTVNYLAVGSDSATIGFDAEIY